MVMRKEGVPSFLFLLIVDVVAKECDGLLETNHEGLVEALRVQADEEEGVGLAGGRIPYGFERGTIDQRGALAFDRLEFFGIPHLEGQEARGVYATRRGY